MNHTMKMLERAIESRLGGIVNITNEQFGVVKAKSTTDAIFALT